MRDLNRAIALAPCSDIRTLMPLLKHFIEQLESTSKFMSQVAVVIVRDTSCRLGLVTIPLGMAGVTEVYHDITIAHKCGKVGLNGHTPNVELTTTLAYIPTMKFSK